MIRPESKLCLPSAFYERRATEVAIDLVGRLLVSDKGGVRTAGRIVETEAYLGAEDLASHAARLRTGRVLVMGGPVGVAYVYRSYGIHAMLNVVAHCPGEVGAVLIRAVEPVAGVDQMRRRRGPVSDRELCSGPGRLCVALGITLDDHGIRVTGEAAVRVEGAVGKEPPDLLASRRIGISRAKDEPWRFFVAGSRFVSAHRRGVPVGRTGVCFTENPGLIPRAEHDEALPGLRTEASTFTDVVMHDASCRSC